MLFPEISRTYKRSYEELNKSDLLAQSVKLDRTISEADFLLVFGRQCRIICEIPSRCPGCTCTRLWLCQSSAVSGLYNLPQGAPCFGAYLQLKVKAVLSLSDWGGFLLQSPTSMAQVAMLGGQSLQGTLPMVGNQGQQNSLPMMIDSPSKPF